MNSPIDYYNVFHHLTQAQRAAWEDLRTMLRKDVLPVADDAWLAGRFPKQVIPAFGAFAQQHLGPDYQWPPADPVLMGLVKLELGRTDPSMASFFAVHWGLTMSCIASFGSEAQKQRWLPTMARFEDIGSFSLSEPLAGSDASQGLRCTATPTADGWVLHGQKKWSGNAAIADVLVIIASGPDKQVLGFLLEPDQPGLRIEPIDDKISKRSVENAVVTLEQCHVPKSAQLVGLSSFRQVAATLGVGRYAVAWEATGIAMGAYEAALRYTLDRQQFGRPIAGFQLVQDKLVRMLAEVTSMQCMVLQLATLANTGQMGAGQAAMGKLTCAAGMRRVVALAREVLGGNGILLEHGVAKLFADAEAVYSYEGTNEMNTLIVGRDITGISAFV